jgi:hypothetical protein
MTEPTSPIHDHDHDHDVRRDDVRRDDVCRDVTARAAAIDGDGFVDGAFGKRRSDEIIGQHTVVDAAADQRRLAGDPGHDQWAHRRAPATRECSWCHATFTLRVGPGRKRIYCTRSCRQRAYERRRGLGVLPPPEVLIARPGGPLAHLPQRQLRYEAGGVAYTRDKIHALRPGGYADAADRRPTLCGLLRAPTGRPFAYVFGRSCETCDKVQQLRPALRSLRVSNDLAALRTQIDSIATRLAHHGVLAAGNDPELAAALLQELLDAA